MSQSSTPDLDDEGGAVFEVPFEAFFDASADLANDASDTGDASTGSDAGTNSAAASSSSPTPASTAANRESPRAPARTRPSESRRASPAATQSFARPSSRRDDFDEYESFDAHDMARAAEKAIEDGGDGYERTSTMRAARKANAASANRQRPERSLKGRALGYLSRREYSRAELSRKLMAFTDNADELEALLDTLERDGWLSDARFAESVVYRRAARVGAGRIVSELKRHAVGEALIEEVSTQLRETELTRALAVWKKKYGQLPETPAERARQARFLAARGFSMSIIGKILKGIEDSYEDGFDGE
ncbi:recombination regulator RecX [Paraburkholderia sp. J94]|uniref:recombination regulator RecX n=1 Tax=Paraburkholderia sp. J94 TaxID=2805441 RepID=UPI002AAFAE55|nr:recombination regulator RecX [Paraburkholderia sp. J94]